MVSGGLSNDAGYGASLGASIGFTALLMIPGIGGAVALTLFGASLMSSIMAIEYGTD